MDEWSLPHEPEVEVLVCMETAIMSHYRWASLLVTCYYGMPKIGMFGVAMSISKCVGPS